jgi:hypothetical protein
MTNPAPLSELLAEFAARARAAGHPILTTGSGRWADTGRYPDGAYVTSDRDLPPNNLLDAAREAARSCHAWAYVEVPAAADAVCLATALHGSAPAMPHHARRGQGGWLELLRRPTSGRRGDPRRIAFRVLVAEIPLSLVTLTAHCAGRTVHVVEIPAAWLTLPFTEVTR